VFVNSYIDSYAFNVSEKEAELYVTYLFEVANQESHHPISIKEYGIKPRYYGFFKGEQPQILHLLPDPYYKAPNKSFKPGTNY
jgi:hypothetical protein